MPVVPPPKGDDVVPAEDPNPLPPNPEVVVVVPPPNRLPPDVGVAPKAGFAAPKALLVVLLPKAPIVCDVSCCLEGFRLA